MAFTDDPISPALNELIDRFGGLVRGVGRRHGLADADVDELVQDVRIRIWRALKDGEKIEAVPASYVYRAAMSAAVDLIRRRRARREEDLHSIPDGRLHTVKHRTAGGPPDEAVESLEALDGIARAVDRLSDSRRPVVRMYLAGYGRQEIADLLGWSEPKTRNLLYRGLADLRTELQRLGLGPGVTL